MNYIVVRFEGESYNSVVPASWYVNGECFWPPRNPEDAVKNLTIPKASWGSLPVKVLSFHGRSVNCDPMFWMSVIRITLLY